MIRRTNLGDLDAFVTIARAGGFRRAAALRGVSGSALSHAMRGLEARLGVRLFHRSTRAISLTAAGEALLAEVEPRFKGIDEAIDRLDRFRSKPAGRVRITALSDAVRLLIGPKVPVFLELYPEIEVEIVQDDRFVDMISEGFDAGIRYGDRIPEAMIASRLTPDLDWVIVGAPSYLDRYGRPKVPDDLYGHRCIRLRGGGGRVYQWELGGGDDLILVDVPGQLMLSDSEASIRMAEAGVGLSYCLKDRVREQLDRGSLEAVMGDWTTPGSGFHAYYASHRQVPTALRVFLDHLKS